jgi:hypothetical protein
VLQVVNEPVTAWVICKVAVAKVAIAAVGTEIVIVCTALSVAVVGGVVINAIVAAV